MGLKRVIQYLKYDIGAGNFNYVMPFNKSWEIIEVGVNGTSVGVGANFIVNGVSMMFLPSDGTRMTLGAAPYVNNNLFGYYEQLGKRFADIPTLKVAPGEQITIQKVGTGGSCTVYVWYKEWESPDILSPNDLGGSANPIKMFNSYIGHSPSILAGATQEEELNLEWNPSGYRDFPIQELVHAGYSYDFLGLSVSADLTSAPNTVCDGIRIWHEDESILGKDEDFVPIDTFPVQEESVSKRLLLFPVPRTFVSNQLMKVEMKYTNSGGSPETVSSFVGLIFRIYPA